MDIVFQERDVSAPNTLGVDAGDNSSTYKSVDAETRQISDGVYEILDENGHVIATYATMQKEEAPQARAGWTIDWTVGSGVSASGTNRFQSYDGLEFDVSIDFSQTGSSNIGIAAHDEETTYWIATSSDGFYGAMTVRGDHGNVSLAITNNSNNSMNYTGDYYI